MTYAKELTDIGPLQVLLDNSILLYSLIIYRILIVNLSGTLDLQLSFSEAIPEPLTLMVMSSYESCIRLQNGMVELNYSL